MSDDFNLYLSIQTEAVSEALNRSNMAFFRKVCRWYSKEFNTPLKEVLDCKNVQWDEVLIHYYESQMETLEYNSIYDMAYQEYIPELAKDFDKENEEFAKSLIEEQKRTLKKKKEKQNKNVTKPLPKVSMSFEDEKEI